MAPMEPTEVWDQWWATTPHRDDLTNLGWDEPPPHWTLRDLKQLPGALDLTHETWVAHSPSGATRNTTRERWVLTMAFWAWLDEQRQR